MRPIGAELLVASMSPMQENFEDAVRKAREIDEQIRLGYLDEEDSRDKPFLGVPFTLKDCMKVNGMTRRR